MYTMYKGDKVATVERDQVEIMKGAGWTTSPVVEEAVVGEPSLGAGKEVGDTTNSSNKEGDISVRRRIL